MKKVISLLVLAIMVIIPMKTNAALDFSGFKCDAAVKGSDGNTTETCYIIGKATNGSSISRFTATLTLTEMSIKSITASSPWTDYSNGTNLSFTASSSVTSDNFTIATIVFNVLGPNCKVAFKPCYTEDGKYGCGDPVETGDKPKCKIVNGTYYGKDGSVVTSAVYNSQCVSNPQTGNFLPYVVIIAGLSLAISVYTISRKNTKLYKI